MQEAQAGDSGSIPGLGRSPEGGNGTPLQYCCLENFKDRGACWATVHRVAKSQTRLSEYACTIDYNCQIIPIMILESNLNLDYLPEKSYGQRSLAGYSPLCHKELDTTE